MPLFHSKRGTFPRPAFMRSYTHTSPGTVACRYMSPAYKGLCTRLHSRRGHAPDFTPLPSPLPTAVPNLVAVSPGEACLRLLVRNGRCTRPPLHEGRARASHVTLQEGHAHASTSRGDHAHSPPKPLPAALASLSRGRRTYASIRNRRL